MQYPSTPAQHEPAANTPALAEGPARDSLCLAMRALDLASHAPHPAKMCEALTDVARCLALQQAYPEAEDYLGQALRWAGLLPQATDLTADLMCALAEVACNEADLIDALGDHSRAGRQRQHQARQRARGWAHDGADASRRTSDAQWEVALLLRASDVLSRGGDRDDAEMLQNHAMALLEIAAAQRLHEPVPCANRLPAPAALM